MHTSPTPPGLPQLSGCPVVTDGGLETDLIFHHGAELPDFAAFPLVDDRRGRDLLREYYRGYVPIAARAGATLQLDTPTWQANTDWAERLGYAPAELRRVNRDSVALLAEVRDDAGLDSFLISGCVGPRGDGYVAGDVVDPDVASAYHAPQIEAFAAESRSGHGAHLDRNGRGDRHRPGRPFGRPSVAVSFTVEQDGALPMAPFLATAVAAVDSEGGPDYFMVNCAHPTHITAGLQTPGPSRSRIVGLRANASARCGGAGLGH